MNPLKLSVPLPDVLHERGGEIRVKGSRISLYDIVTANIEAGKTAPALVFRYPTLSLDPIEQVLAFYRANRAAVDDYLAACQAEIAARLASLPPGTSRADLQARLAARAAVGTSEGG